MVWLVPVIHQAVVACSHTPLLGSGRVLTVDFGTGKRQILVRPSLQVILVSPGTPAMVKPGVKLSVATFRFAPDAPPSQIITIAKADLK